MKRKELHELEITPVARRLLEKRYLRKDLHGNITETVDQLWHRVAGCVSAAELTYGGEGARQTWDREFYRIMSRGLFLPNSPTLFNACRDPQMLNACFVLGVADSLEGILEVTKQAGLIQKAGGGVGFDFSGVRPRGAIVRSTAGVASGPVSFMRGIDAWAQVIKQGGLRRAANMAVLSIHHPDVEEFVQCKVGNDKLSAFNLSVGVTDEFMNSLCRGDTYRLIDPQTGEEAGRRDTAEIWELICRCAWQCGDPGLLFLDTINMANPTPLVGKLEATNPCGEQPLLPYESCNLGSINLLEMVKGNDVDWGMLRETTKVGVRFLDDVIDVTSYHLFAIERISKGNRKIGLGVMGFADLLYTLGIPYDSAPAIELAERLMKEISDTAKETSENLAAEKGVFPNFTGSIYDRPGVRPIRNATRTTIAPTGTISLIAGVSSGIEPNFSLAYRRQVAGGEFLVVNRVFEEAIQTQGITGPRLWAELLGGHSLRDIGGVPTDVSRVFVSALDIEPVWHVRVQAAFQKFVDNSVSKTVNLRHTCTIKTVMDVFMAAWRLGCKGVTIYRDRSKAEQVLSMFMHINDRCAGCCGMMA